MMSLFENYMKNQGNYNVTIDNEKERLRMLSIKVLLSRNKTMVYVLMNFFCFNTFMLNKYNNSSL